MKLPKLTRKKGPKGKYTGNYLCKVRGFQVNLGTKLLDGPDGAIERSKEALAGRRNFRSDLDKAVDQMETTPATAAPLAPPASAPLEQPPAPTAAPPPAAPGGVTPDAVLPPPPRPLLVAVPNDAAEEAAANAAAAAETAGSKPDDAQAAESAPDPEVSLDELADLGVTAQVWCAAEYARAKVYRAFPTPEIADEGKQKLAEQWKKILNYSGASALLPPWVTGLVIPACVLVTSTVAMARGFAEAAKDMKERAGGATEPASNPQQAAA